MLRPRIIPCLLMQNGGLVKTVKFGSPKYVGDPLNAVRIFNEKEVDEIVVLDIDATMQGREPNFEVIRSLAAECRMPLCYGGGVKSVGQVERIISLGVEKIALGAVAIEDPMIIELAAHRVGQQSLVVVIDALRDAEADYHVMIRNGKVASGREPGDFAREVEARGAGEIVVNSIDRDGCMNGYDFDLIARIRNSVSVPVTALGGAGSLAHVAALISRFGTIGASAGSLFVFKGPYRAVLINYPSRRDKDELLDRALASG